MQRLNEIKTILFGRYEVRKTDAQKSAFIDWMREYAQAAGLTMRVEESGKLIKTRNIVFGDLKTARTMITAHYDTCARMPVPNFMTPACWPVIVLTQLLLPVIVFWTLGLAVGFFFAWFLPMLLPETAAEILMPFLCAAVIFGVVGLMLFGPQNPHTANDNTSGVAAVLRLMCEYAGRKDVAFVLFDNEEKGLLGSSAFVKAHGAMQRQAFVVNLDCVSDGDTLLYVYAILRRKLLKRREHPLRARVALGPLGIDVQQRMLAALEELAPEYGKRAMSGQSPRVLYPSDQMAFVKGTAFAALKGRRVLYLDRIHTAKDTAFDDKNLLCLIDVIRKAI